LFIGDKKISNEFKKIYDIVLEAQLMAIDKCREGVRASELDGIVRKFISSKGYGRNFNHGLGHGVGLEIHEGPVVGQVNKEVLKENMIVTIEPGIYIENFGGVRIEDTVLVKKNTCEVLNEARKDFLILSSY
jgi:Xaa-Pro aminopeptidase